MIKLNRRRTKDRSVLLSVREHTNFVTTVDPYYQRSNINQKKSN